MCIRDSHRTAKSSGAERTYSKDLTDGVTMREEITRMAHRTASRLHQRQQRAVTVTIKVRYSDFTTVTRSHSERPPTSDANRITARAHALLKRTEAATRPGRLLGISLLNISRDDPADDASQEPRLPLFP